LNPLKKLYRAVFRTEVTINLIYKNFKHVEKKVNPKPVSLEGYEIDCEPNGNIITVGGDSDGVTIPPKWLGQIANGRKVKKQYVTNENGEAFVVLSKPLKEELV